MRLLLLLQENCVDFPVHLPGYKCQTSRIITSKKRGRKKQEKQKKKAGENREREIRLVIVNSSLTLSVLEDKTRPLRKL